MKNEGHKALQADFDAAKQHGVGAEIINTAFNRKGSWAYQICEGKLPFPFHGLPTWCRLTGAHNAMRWAATVTGHIAVPMPDLTCRPEHDIAVVLRAFGDLVCEVGVALDDGKVTPVELEVVEARAVEAMTAIQAEVEALRIRTRAPSTGRRQTLKATG